MLYIYYIYSSIYLAPVQVKVENAVPAKIVGIKPKFWLTCGLSIQAHHVVKLSVS